MRTPRKSLSNLGNTLRTRRAARLRRAKLADELAAYNSPSERAELDAVLSRHSAEQTLEIDRILTHQAIRLHAGINARHTRPAR